jgi:hypothetical protein
MNNSGKRKDDYDTKELGFKFMGFLPEYRGFTSNYKTSMWVKSKFLALSNNVILFHRQLEIELHL